ncbi:Imidazolonepropionase-like amidohydrolase [Tenacibaculum sp. 190524A02b]
MQTRTGFLCFLFLCISSFGFTQTKIIAFENVHIIPMDKDTILPNKRVIIQNGRIHTIESASKPASIPIDEIIPASGKYLMPGLAETHYHLQNNIQNEFKLLIANGITSARNMAEYPGQDQITIRNQVQKNAYLAPHYYTAGPYLMRKDFRNTHSVDSIIKLHLTKGYNYLKLADNLPKETYLKLLAETQKNHIDIIGHGQRNLPLEFSLRMKSIAHVEEFMNILPKKVLLSDALLNQAAQQVKTSGVYVSPTLGIFEMIGKYASKEGSEVLHKNPNLKYLPKHYVNYWTSDKINYRTHSWFTTPESLKRLARELKWQQKFTLILHQNGVPLMAGSDTYGLFLPGFSLHHELELIHSAGLSTYETLKTATVVPARYFNTYSQSGTITEGKLADVVLLEKNPLENIQHTRSVLGVMLKGKWMNRKKLDAYLLEVAQSYQTKK